MPDSPSVHPPPFAYSHHVYRDAADAAKARSDGHCQECGEKLPLEAHHWARRYLPAHETTADALTGLCRTCHIKAHIAIFFKNAGGSPEVLCAALSEIAATLLHSGTAGLPGSPMRVGWAVRRAGRGPVGRGRHRRVAAAHRRSFRALHALEARVADRRRDRSPRRPAGMLACAQAVVGTRRPTDVPQRRPRGAVGAGYDAPSRRVNPAADVRGLYRQSRRTVGRRLCALQGVGVAVGCALSPSPHPACGLAAPALVRRRIRPGRTARRSGSAVLNTGGCSGAARVPSCSEWAVRCPILPARRALSPS